MTYFLELLALAGLFATVYAVLLVGCAALTSCTL